MFRVSTFILAILLIVAVGVDGYSQRRDWKTASSGNLKFEVPREFETTSGTMPGFLADRWSNQSFELRYLTAANYRRYIFAAAGYGLVFINPNYPGDMDDLASESLSKILSNINIPGIGWMRIDVANAEVAQYETMGIQVSETKALSVASGREYRVYFALAFRRADSMRARMVYMITGCPEADIKENNQVLSTILSSFKEPE
jgi:hypothetical protein